METRLAPAVSARFLLVYSVIIFVTNAVWIHLHRLLFGLFTFFQITEPKSTFIFIWSPRNIWGLKGALVPINSRITDIRESWNSGDNTSPCFRTLWMGNAWNKISCTWNVQQR
jgi:hypothetical protein